MSETQTQIHHIRGVSKPAARQKTKFLSASAVLEHSLTLDDLMKVQRVEDPQISLDGKREVSVLKWFARISRTEAACAK
jgi:hypothetical protein